jgi:1-acyl-sn-glycerol-3-phosphate acyltransferase
MTLPAWLRRAITVPAYFALAATYFALAPAWLALGLVLDAVSGAARRLPRTRALLFFALYLACEIVGIVCALGLGVVLLGGLVGGPRRWVAANAALQRAWSGALFGGSVRIFSMKLDVEGLDVARRGPLLLFVRHSSTADTVLAAALVANPNRLLLRYVLKRELLWDPCLDIVGLRLPNTFVDRRSPRSDAEIDAVARLAVGLDESSGVLVYPEGTRFSPEKLARARAKLGEHGKADLVAIAERYEHVLPPRIGGPLALLERAPGVDVLFVEHTGFEGAASFARFWGGALVGRTIHVRLRRVTPPSAPREELERWLFEEWAKIDRWIGAQVVPP